MPGIVVTKFWSFGLCVPGLFEHKRGLSHRPAGIAEGGQNQLHLFGRRLVLVVERVEWDGEDQRQTGAVEHRHRPAFDLNGLQSTQVDYWTQCGPCNIADAAFSQTRLANDLREEPARDEFTDSRNARRCGPLSARVER
jgi:hypothetical protein